MPKQQAAVEFIITYSWAILIISLFVVLVLIISDIRPPQDYLQSTCNIQPSLPCIESLLAYNATSPLQYYVVFSNQLGAVLYFPSSSISLNTGATGGSGTSTFLGNCTPSFASEGATVLCRARVSGLKASPGTQEIV